MTQRSESPWPSIENRKRYGAAGRNVTARKRITTAAYTVGPAASVFGSDAELRNGG
jgi:hypothetical protein